MSYFIKRQKKWALNPEDILLDKKFANQFDNSKFEVPVSQKNTTILYLIILSILSIFIIRSGYLQIIKHDTYSSLAQNNKTRQYPILAQRGIISDRNKVALVSNTPSFDLVVIPADLPKDKIKRNKAIKELSGLITIPSTLLFEFFSKIQLADVYPILIKENIEREVALFLETKLNDIPGIELKKNIMREYINGADFAHIIGHIGRISEKDLKKNSNLFAIDSIGKAGVEAFYDSYIRGINGIIEREINAVSHFQKESITKNKTQGAEIILTVDKNLQEKITKTLQDAITKSESATGASAIALDPRSGEILALVSLPSYNNNIFLNSASRQAYQNTKNDPQRPFFNRAISGRYPPGSSIKPFIAVAALSEGIITPSTRIASTGSIIIKNPYNPGVIYTFRDWKKGGHGMTDIYKALEESVNTYFFTIGGGYERTKGLGIENIEKYLALFGFGQKTGIDIGGEDSGVIPSPDWKRKILNENWVLGDTYNTSIGQGNLLVTPLQLAIGYAALANGGYILNPFLVKKIIDKDGSIIFENKKSLTQLAIIDSVHLETVRKGLRRAVSGAKGTARRLADLPVAVAGKTGTAQAGHDKTHSWFSSFAPYDNPEIVLIILVENGGESTDAAVPAAKEIYKWYFERENKKN